MTFNDRFGPFPLDMRTELEQFALERYGEGHFRVTVTLPSGVFVEGNSDDPKVRCFFDNLLGAVRAGAKAEKVSDWTTQPRRVRLDAQGFVIPTNAARRRVPLTNAHGWSPFDRFQAWNPYAVGPQRFKEPT